MSDHLQESKSPKIKRSKIADQDQEIVVFVSKEMKARDITNIQFYMII